MSNHYFTKEPTSKIYKGIIQTRLRGKNYAFLSASGIFSMKYIDNGTRILVENMRLPEQGTILDLGCGYGVIGLVVASLKPELDVIMTDVNKRATAIAQENIERMQLSNARVVTGNLYDPIKNEKFDAIISNPPISAGMNKIVRLIVYGAVDHLNSGGTIQLVIKWKKGGRILANFLEDVFGSYEVLKRKSGYRIFLSSYEP